MGQLRYGSRRQVNQTKMAGGGHTRWTQVAQKTCLVVLLVECTITAAEYTSIWREQKNNVGHSTFSIAGPSSWWEGAEDGCGEYGGQLYLPRTDSSLPPELSRRLEDDTSYWVGAVQNSRWIWTSDKTPLYSFQGHSDLPQHQAIPIPGNSVFKCHLQCQDNTVFGLRGDECYCLSGRNLQLTASTGNRIRCSGSYDEFCGSDRQMSVYKLDTISLVPDEEGQCGVAVERSKNVVTLFQSPDCGTRTKYLACHKPTNKPKKCKGNVCTKPQLMTWEAASKKCRLLKVTNGNRKSLSGAMATYNERRPSTTTYWVGLRRTFSWRWINGSKVGTTYGRDADIDVCLAVSITRPRGSPHRVSFIWEPCVEDLQSICETVDNRLPTTWRATTPSPVGTTPREQDRNPTTQTTIDSNTTSLDPQAAGVMKQDNTGDIVGAVIGSLVVVGVCVAVVFLIHRKGKFCFASQSKSSTATMKFNNVSHNNDEPYYSTPSLHDVATLPIAVVKPTKHVPSDYINVDVKTDIQKPADESYYSTADLHDTSAVPTAVIKPNRHQKSRMYVNDPQLSKEDEYNTFSDSSSPAGFSDHIYNHVCAGEEHHGPGGEYSVAGGAINEPPLYLELEPDNVVNEGEMSQEATPEVRDNIYDEANLRHDDSVAPSGMYSLEAQVQHSSGQSGTSDLPTRHYSALDISGIGQNVYRHIGDNEGNSTGGMYEVALGSTDHPSTVPTPGATAADPGLYSLAGQRPDVHNTVVNNNTDSDRDYLLQGSVPETDNGENNVYSLANNSSTA